MKESPGSQSAITLKLNRLARRRVSSGWAQGERERVIGLLSEAAADGNLSRVVARAIDQVAVAARTFESDHIRDWPTVNGVEQRCLIAVVIREAIEKGREVVYDWTVDPDDHFVIRDFEDTLSVTFYNPPNPGDPLYEWVRPGPR